MLQRIPWLFDKVTVAVVVLLGLISLGIVELASDVLLDVLPPAAVVGSTSPRPHSSLVVPLRNFALPNYWLWYSPEDVTRVLASHGRVDLYPLIAVTLLNACLSTWAVGAANVFVMMFLAVRRLPRYSAWNNFYVVACLSMAADLVEDLCLLVVLINYPVGDVYRWQVALAWGSFLKFVLWLLCVVFDGALLVQLLRFGPLVKDRSDTE